MLPDAGDRLKWTYGVSAFQHWAIQRNRSILSTTTPEGIKQFFYSLKTILIDLETTITNQYLIKSDLLSYSTTDELQHVLDLFLREVRRPTGDEYLPESIYYLCLGKFLPFLFLNLISSFLKVYSFI